MCNKNSQVVSINAKVGYNRDMKIKSFIFALCTLALVFGVNLNQTILAQGVGSSCTPYNYNLGFGMRGGDVARLQYILISKGFLGNGFATGYFGSMTRLAVQRFQASNNISTTGFVGPLTRSILYNMSCSNNPNPPIYNQAPIISSISPAVTSFGTWVTVYGSNFSRTNTNAINLGTRTNYKKGIVSNDGTTIRFELSTLSDYDCPVGYTCSPSTITNGTYPLTVSNQFGTSNSLNIQITNSNPNSQTPTITSISPSSGPYGTNVTIYGTNFNRNSGNSINFANAQNVKTAVYSPDGTSMQFTIPATPCSEGYSCAQVALNPGYYGLSVHNGVGTSNIYNFQITNSDINPGGPNLNPVINSVEGPTTLAVGQQGSWTIRASNSAGGNIMYSVLWGDETTQGNAAAINDTYLQSTTFTHAYQNPGTYTARFTVRNTLGREVTSTISVVVAGNTTTNAPTLTTLSPTIGQFGNPITITGTNFSRYDNVVNFGTVRRAGVGIPSYDGKTMQFTPSGSVCAADAYVCTLQMMADGDYTVTVTTPLGTTNALMYKISSAATTQNQVLSLGQTATVGTVRVTPVAIVEDSRCPANVTCIQAGRVVVRTEIGSSYSYTSVGLTSNGEVFTTDDGYKIKIVDVTPVKTSTSTIPNSEYKITYMIDR